MSEAKIDATSRCFSFLCDSRVQLLSSFSECILNRFRELHLDYPNLFNENGDLPAPTDEELLNRLYPHKNTHCRPTDIALCITAQLDPAGLVSFSGTGLSRCVRLHFLGLAARTGDSLSEPDRRKVGLIHIAGPDPPLIKTNAVGVAAATAVSSSDLIEKLKPFFPRHDLVDEWRRYKLRRKKDGQPPIAVSKSARCLSFVKWMENADVPVRSGSKFDAIDPLAGQEELNFTEPATPRFMAEFESRKARRAATG